MISQLTLRIIIAKKEHCIRKCGDKKLRLKQRLSTCEPSVNTGDLCSASRFYVFTAMTFSLIWSSDLYYWKESWTNKTIQWDYIGKYTSEKRNELLKYWWKKHWTQRIEKDWIKSHKRCYAVFFFFSQFFSQQGTKHWLLFKPRFILLVSERKWPRVYCIEPCVEITQGRWNKEGMGGSY